MPDDTSTEDSAIRQWDRYWSHGFLTSCSTAYEHNYEGIVVDLWNAFCAELDRKARILDVCTGNGAVAALAARWALENDAAFTIHGIDLARIQPQAALRAQPELAARIAFHPQTPADRTGFEESSFDAIVGQYALEYTPIERTLAEMSRIAAPGCRVMFIAHHHDSVILRTTAEELRHGQVLFNTTRLFEVMRDFVRYVGSVTVAGGRSALSADHKAESLRTSLNEAASQVAEAAAKSSHPEMLQNALNTLHDAYQLLDRAGLAACLERLEQGRQAIRLNLERLEDLRGAALSTARCRALAEQFRATGFETPQFHAVYHEDGDLLAWRISSLKPD